MGTYIECRTCLGVFNDDDSVHVETKVINQKNVLQAIEEIASIQVENDGLPEHICKICFRSLESSLTFRIQIISSNNELKRRVSRPLTVNDEDPIQLSNKNQNGQNIEYKEDVKEENEGLEALFEKEERLKVPLQENNYAGIQSSEGNSDNDWNSFKNSSSDEELNRKSLLRKSRVKRKNNKTEINDDKITDKKLPAADKQDETDNGNNDDDDDDNDDRTSNTTKRKLLKCSDKSTTVSEKVWSDFSDESNSSDNFNRKGRKESFSKSLNKKTAIQTRKVRRKRRVTKKAIKDISDTSSDSESDSDIPLGELRKEIKDLENKTEPKVRKKREKREQADGPRLCPICGKLFKARQNFNSHMTTVHRKKPDKPEKISCLCPDCGRVITGTRQNFVAHRRYHHSDKAQVKKRFTCDVCPRKFYREKNLIIHQRIHKGEKGYVCELCPDKSYTQIGGLILHKRKVHLKKPTCTCNYCGKQFYEKHYLETHIRQWHTGERPFSCEICGKSFSCNGTLLRHRKDSHGEKQPCPKCGKMYTEGELRKHLKRHKIREEGIKRKKYTCEYCGTEMNFTSRKRHLLKQHGIMLRGRGETAERIPISRADAM